jgi:protein phosphatase
MVMTKINCFGKTDTGLVRKNNEDTFIVKPDMGFCLVADGMGGAAAGELASRIFAETALKVFLEAKGRSETGNKEQDQTTIDSSDDATIIRYETKMLKQDQTTMDSSDDATIIRYETEILKQVQATFILANEKILNHVKETPHHEGMGCTAELIAFSEDDFVLGHVGDSRTYRIRNGQLEQLTKDHSLVQEQIDQGLISPEEARNHSLRKVISRVVGVEERVVQDILRGKTYAGDLFLLCSDGLTDMVDDNLISQVLSSAIDLPQKTEKLVEMAKSAGGRDNVTVVLSEIL